MIRYTQKSLQKIKDRLKGYFLFFDAGLDLIEDTWKEYNKIEESALKEYNKIKQPALEEYKKIQESVLKECNYYLKIISKRH